MFGREATAIRRLGVHRKIITRPARNEQEPVEVSNMIPCISPVTRSLPPPKKILRNMGRLSMGLSARGEGKVTYEDFIDGVLRCKGPARAIDQSLRQHGGFTHVHTSIATNPNRTIWALPAFILGFKSPPLWSSMTTVLCIKQKRNSGNDVGPKMAVFTCFPLRTSPNKATKPHTCAARTHPRRQAGTRAHTHTQIQTYTHKCLRANFEFFCLSPK